jgi:hypothetical protein
LTPAPTSRWRYSPLFLPTAGCSRGRVWKLLRQIQSVRSNPRATRQFPCPDPNPCLGRDRARPGLRLPFQPPVSLPSVPHRAVLRLAGLPRAHMPAWSCEAWPYQEGSRKHRVFAFFGQLTEYGFGIHRMSLATVAKHRINHIVVIKSILRVRFEGHCHHARLAAGGRCSQHTRCRRPHVRHSYWRCEGHTSAVCINLHQRSAIRSWFGFVDPHSF